MAEVINVKFSTRREADIALEHLVQEYDVKRTDIFIAPVGDDNSAGREAAGADAKGGHADQAAIGQPALAGDIEVSVDVNDQRGPALRQALTELGGSIEAHPVSRTP